MSSHILLATVTGIALSTPAWAHDPAEAPIDRDIRGHFLGPGRGADRHGDEDFVAREHRGAFAGGHRSCAIRPRRPSRRPYRPHSRGTPAGTDERKLCRGLGPSAAFRRSSVLRPRPASRVPIAAARSILRSSTCMSAWTERARVAVSFIRIQNRHDPGSSPELPVLDGFDRVDQHNDVQGQIVPDHIPDPSFQGDSESNGCPDRQASGQHEPQRGGKHIHL